MCRAKNRDGRESHWVVDDSQVRRLRFPPAASRRHVLTLCFENRDPLVQDRGLILASLERSVSIPIVRHLIDASCREQLVDLRIRQLAQQPCGKAAAFLADSRTVQSVSGSETLRELRLTVHSARLPRSDAL